MATADHPSRSPRFSAPIDKRRTGGANHTAWSRFGATRIPERSGILGFLWGDRVVVEERQHGVLVLAQPSATLGFLGGLLFLKRPGDFFGTSPGAAGNEVGDAGA